jgi:hypothetical protein
VLLAVLVLMYGDANSDLLKYYHTFCPFDSGQALNLVKDPA